MNGFTFRVIRQRWNMNAVRLPVSAAAWKRDGKPYLDKVAAVVALANSEGLLAVLAAQEDARSGSVDTGLPSAALVDFWKACAAAFAQTPAVIFALFNEPSTRNIPGSTPGVHRATDWQVWRNGGANSAGMQDLVNAIRGAGAQQLIAAAGFQDRAGFQGLGAGMMLA